MTMVPIDEKVLEKRLQDAGGAKQLVTKVIDALERAISDYARDRKSFDDTLLDPLKPDLDVLITITEQTAALIKSDEDHDERMLQTAEHAIGDCNDRMQALQQHIDEVNADIARGSATAANDQEKLKDLQAEIEENDRKIAEVRDRMKKASKWWWVPGYNLYLLGSTLDDLIANRGSTLIDKVRDQLKERDWTVEHLKSSHARVKVLTGEKLDMERKIEALNDSKTSFERRSKVYAARFHLLSDAVMYYRLLRDAEWQIEENLDLPKEIEKLNKSEEYVHPTGEVRRDTLKGELIHVAEEYDLYKKHLDAEGVSISFKLFSINEPLPRDYQLATVQEVKNHRLELLKAMPSWEIANLADGSVDGARYGGSVSPNLRTDVSQKLAVEEYDHYKKRLDGQHAEGMSISFKLFNINEPLPRDYQLATVQEVKNHRLELLKAMPSWEIANLADGSVDGARYGGSVSPNLRTDVSQKLAVKEYDYYKKRLDGQHAEGVSISFKLFNINETLPRDYQLATVQEVKNHRLELLKAMPSWEIANLADGSVDGARYGGSVSPNLRTDVSQKLAIETSDIDI